MQYSISEDAAYCKYCILFGDNSSKRGVHLVPFHLAGFTDWKNAKGLKRGALLNHESSEAHKIATTKALAFKFICEGKSKDILSSLSKAREDLAKQNREILLSIIDLVIVLGQRNIPFRGHEWDKASKRENGNFDFFLHWKSQFDEGLKRHIEHGKRNATYRSPDIQNELIDLCGMEIKDKILDDVRSARWFAVMADECTDVSTLEQMSMCFRFVDESKHHQPEIREEFVGFVKLQKADADTIYKEIMEFIRDCNLDVANLRGQGYDGASVMAGKVTGVATQILRQQPKAMYCHCRAHNLNLVVSSTCKQVPEIRNLFDTLRNLTWFIGGSAKRKEILKKYLMSDDISRLFVGENADLPEEEQEEADKWCLVQQNSKFQRCVKQDGQLAWLQSLVL